MPGPVPCVSTKTRGYIQPPSFHTGPTTPLTYNPYASPARFYYPGPTYHPRNRSMSTTVPQHSHEHGFSNQESESYIPSYQKKVHINPTVQTQYYTPNNLVHRQFNSPISLYSNENVQEVMSHHINQIR